MVALSYGDHDLRLLDTTLEEACEVAGRPMPSSPFHLFDRGIVVYCPSCGSSTFCPYSSQPMDPSSSRVRAVGDAQVSFIESFPESCESTRRLSQVSEVMNT